MERTLILLKPDAVQRRLCGRILARFEDKGLKPVGMKLVRVAPEQASEHYAVHRGKPFYQSLIAFITSGPVVALVLEGHRAIAVCRKLLGATFGFDAEPGTIRGDFGISTSNNLVHASDSKEAAAREIAIFFGSEELLDFPACDAEWVGEA